MTVPSPKLLLLAHPFPPCRAIGAVRCWNIAKHLAKKGWSVEVVAPSPALLANPEPGVDIDILCQSEGIRCRWTQYDWRMLTNGSINPRIWERSRTLSVILAKLAKQLDIESSIGWMTAAERACQPLNVGEVDLILASGSPFSSFELAHRLSQKLNCPYVLDYRDPWTTNPFHNLEHNRRIVQRERTITQNAAGIIVVSRPWAKELQDRFGLHASPTVITNGIDLDEWNSITSIHFDDFAVVYAGRFYPPSRTITPVIKAIARANTMRGEGQKPIRLHYYGKYFSQVAHAAKENQAAEWCVDHGLCSREEVLAALRGAGAVAVVVDSENEKASKYNTFLPGKLFEALGSGAPILAVASQGSEVSSILAQSHCGAAFSGKQTNEMADWLLNVNDNNISFSDRNVSRYSWPEVSTMLDGYLRSVIKQYATNSHE